VPPEEGTRNSKLCFVSFLFQSLHHLLTIGFLLQTEDHGDAGGADRGAEAEDRINDPTTGDDEDVTRAKDVENVAQDTTEDDRDPEV
jgi:hypothetical protein